MQRHAMFIKRYTCDLFTTHCSGEPLLPPKKPGEIVTACCADDSSDPWIRDVTLHQQAKCIYHICIETLVLIRRILFIQYTHSSQAFVWSCSERTRNEIFQLIESANVCFLTS